MGKNYILEMPTIKGMEPNKQTELGDIIHAIEMARSEGRPLQLIFDVDEAMQGDSAFHRDLSAVTREFGGRLDRFMDFSPVYGCSFGNYDRAIEFVKHHADGRVPHITHIEIARGIMTLAGEYEQLRY